MSVHIWCPRFSDSAISIREALKSTGLKVYKSKKDIHGKALRRFLDRVKRGDLWINWGPPRLPVLPDVVTLNSSPQLNKKQQLLKLSEHGVPTLEVSDTSKEGWLGRSFNHQQGRDLLKHYGRDYWTRKVEFVRELRIHIYKGKSIHAGLKVPRDSNPHPWIRSYESGWKIDYSRASNIKQDRRDVAKQAIKALSLDFGAVDIGITKDNKPIVIEVNTAPGLDPGPSVDVYVAMFLGEIRN